MRLVLITTVFFLLMGNSACNEARKTQDAGSEKFSKDQAKKKFRLNVKDIKQLVRPYGYCFATDKITVDGAKVGFMYREKPDRSDDSGWRFFSGTESQQYVDDPANTAIYNVNTIANYDPEIIPFLDAPFGSAFERGQQSGSFEKVPFPKSPNGK